MSALTKPLGNGSRQTVTRTGSLYLNSWSTHSSGCTHEPAQHAHTCFPRTPTPHDGVQVKAASALPLLQPENLRFIQACTFFARILLSQTIYALGAHTTRTPWSSASSFHKFVCRKANSCVLPQGKNGFSCTCAQRIK